MIHSSDLLGALRRLTRSVPQHRFRAVLTPSRRDWQHPWLRISLLLRLMLTERWSTEAWPKVRAEFKKALTLRRVIRRAGWFN